MPVYKNDNGNTWYTSFYYTDWTGNRKRKKKEGFTKKSAAQAYEREFLNKASASCDMTFGSFIELYMEDCRSRLKVTTYQNKEYVVNLKLLPFFQNMPINTIDAVTVRKWQNELLSSENNYSQTYLKTLNNQLSAVMNFAVKYYKLPVNPVRVCGSMGKKNAGSMKFWTVEEFKKFITALENDPSSKVIFELLFWTGMRSGELLALTLNDFDFNAMTISISKNYSRLGKEDLILEPKTPKSNRIITIPKFLCNMVKEYVSSLYDYNSNERLFRSSKCILYRKISQGCIKSGVKKIRVHDLRHSHASFLIEMGFSPLLISERLGHENIETTLGTYSHLYPNKQSEVADKIEQIAMRD